MLVGDDSTTYQVFSTCFPANTDTIVQFTIPINLTASLTDCLLYRLFIRSLLYVYLVCHIFKYNHCLCDLFFKKLIIINKYNLIR